MSQSNGKVATEQAQAVVQQATGKLRPDADLLNSADMRRARAMLKELHGDDAPDPYELVAAPLFEDRLSMIIWCLRSRTDPTYTWEQAEHVTFGELDLSVEEPPEATGPGGSPGPTAAKSAPTGSRSKQPADTTAPS
ncbi:MAG TPA: hypothetical protein VGJ95_08900 [Pseudonocardiaceae bacterium]|jgi:hypothetical protein